MHLTNVTHWETLHAMNDIDINKLCKVILSVAALAFALSCMQLVWSLTHEGIVLHHTHMHLEATTTYAPGH